MMASTFFVFPQNKHDPQRLLPKQDRVHEAIQSMNALLKWLPGVAKDKIKQQTLPDCVDNPYIYYPQKTESPLEDNEKATKIILFTNDYSSFSKNNDDKTQCFFFS